MSATDKVENAAEHAKGKIKETPAKISDNDRLEAEGKGDQVAAKLKKSEEGVKDEFKE